MRRPLERRPSVRHRVVVTGAGMISALAAEPAGLHAALCAGRSGLQAIELFPTAGLVALPVGEIRPFDAQAHLGYDRNLRPIDRTSRLLLIAAQQALAAAGWTAEAKAEHELGLVLGTIFCSVRTIAEFDRRGQKLGPAYASPLDFANSVINAAAGQAAIWHDLRGMNSTVSCGEASGLAALAYAVEAVRAGRNGAVLAGGAEELCFESYLGLLRTGRLAGADGSAPRAVPFDAGRNGFAQAEAAALLMLEDGDLAAQRDAPVLAEVLGWGSAFAASPDEEAKAHAVARAATLALADAGLEPAAIDVLSVGASGSVVGDRAEARGLAAALGEAAASVPVVAIKAMLGETLGASGALQAVALLGSFGDGRLPGIAGLEAAEPSLGLGGLAPATRHAPVRHALLTALAHDGQCYALVLAKPPGLAKPSGLAKSAG